MKFAYRLQPNREARRTHFDVDVQCLYCVRNKNLIKACIVIFHGFRSCDCCVVLTIV